MKTESLFGTSLFATLSLALFAVPDLLWSAEDDAKAIVSAAIKKLAEQPSYSWQTKAEAAGGPARGFRAPGFVGGDPTTGQYEAAGYTSVSQPGLKFVTKSGKAAVLFEELWMTPQQAAARGGEAQRGPGQFSAAAITG